ncbi:hypothetical protein BOTBODRAFT_558027 [Botryobasidium botryosum FD-172 SS1]|uniref:BZIP domain-containing protein n=1 Tax=Botryobasidium botryosum (strain FD-172 SS1) TaxID=930990 RepID=A0A067LZQ3_BOTB1|nr:hypothetical protein BOTBODRAFT_558027 [Botryobasidium botryosum FD-172 SS1]
MIATANKPPEFAFPSPSSPTMEDFFDISQFGPQSSRESSHSPSSSTHPLDLPPTPPQQTPPSSFLTDVDANLADVFFRSYLAAEANKAASSTSAFLPESPFQPSPSMAMSDIYDPQPSAMSFSELFPSYSGLPLAAEPSLFTPPSSAISAPSSSASPLNAMPFAIDPQLVASPSPTAPTPGPSGENATDDEGDDDDDLDEDEEPLFLKAAKGGKVSKIKRPTHTVASGGVVKRTSAAVSTSKSFDKDSDDWRPSPEEYKKLSSKEKRQLRNKISARNFRVRRKGE